MNKTTIISLVVGVIALCLLVVVVAKYQADQKGSQIQTNSSTNTTQQTTAEAVQTEDLVVGEGAEVKVGDTITVHYIGFLPDGSQFESSYDGGQPATFQLAQGSLIEGWVEGIPGMKEGGKRKLVIPSDKAYGESGNGSIPPNTDLTFEVELMSVSQ